MATTDDVARFRENFVEEVNAAWLYRVAADIEEDEAVAGVYLRLAETEERHAELWADRLRDAGEAVPSTAPSSRSRMLGWLAKRWGVGVLSNVMASTERAGRTMYDNQPEAAGTSLPADERSHAVILDALRRESAAAPGNGGVRGGVLARLEGRHRAVGGNALRAAVLGANDGLVSNTSLVMGIAGAAFAADAVLLTGLAGLLAGAISMALGEWLSVQSSRELNQAQIATERAEILEMPEAEAEELALIYQAKGMSQEEAERAAADIMSDPDAFLDTMVREELGIDPDELGGSAWQAAGTSFALFSLGAIVPVIPFFWLAGGAAVILSLALAGIALFALGATTALITGTGVVRTGTRSLLLGLIAAGVTYGIGVVLGVTVG
ncbi:VIT1/CCC1 transporter family protein [Euzebya pacifica]|uniref:VIT1/CCC1 transporter family protein n=1 Tax=Euzebya pacifica TaxID=1608957 RepID=UPI0030FC938F